MSLQWLLASGELQRHLRRVRRHHASQRDRLLSALAHVGPDVRFRGQDGGLHIVLTMGDRPRDEQLARQLRGLRVGFQTIREFGGDSDEVLLGYGHMNASEIEQAARLLHEALAGLRTGQRAARRLNRTM